MPMMTPGWRNPTPPSIGVKPAMTRANTCARTPEVRGVFDTGIRTRALVGYALVKIYE